MSEVFIAKAGSYDEKELESAIFKCLESSDFFGGIIRPGMKVLVKPNLLSYREPGACVTTHPNVIAAVIKAIRKAGAEPFAGDSPSVIKDGLLKLWEKTGMLDVCRKAGVKLVSFEEDAFETSKNGHSLWLTEYARRCDAIVSVPKMKTHTFTLMTGAVKNTYGFVPGYAKTRYHKMFPDVKSFSETIVNVFEIARPHFTVTDAVFAMEGNGPSAGTPKFVGAIVAGADCVAIDASLAAIAGINPLKVLTTRIAGERNLGESDLKKIKFPLLRPEDVKPASFTVPKTKIYHALPPAISKLLSRFFWIRPDFNDNCAACGICVQKCPAKALELKGRKPELSAAKCIECFCCQEVCPNKAVGFRHSALAKFIVNRL